MALKGILDHDNLRNSLIYVLLKEGYIVGRVFALKKPNQKTWTAAITTFVHEGPLGGRSEDSDSVVNKLRRVGVVTGGNAVSPLLAILSEVGFKDRVIEYERPGRASDITMFFEDLGYEVFQVC